MVEELEAVLLSDVVERADVRMVEPGDDPRLALETLAPIGLRRGVGWQDLDRDGAADPGVDRTVDIAHAPAAEQDADFVRPLVRRRPAVLSREDGDYAPLLVNTLQRGGRSSDGDLGPGAGAGCWGLGAGQGLGLGIERQRARRFRVAPFA